MTKAERTIAAGPSPYANEDETLSWILNRHRKAKRVIETTGEAA